MLTALTARFVAAGAVGVIAQRRDGDAVDALAAGRAALEPGAGLPDVAGHFRIGSVTKTFTATVVLQLLHRDLDRSVTRWLPAVGDDRITLRHLLTHRSGLHNYTDDLTDPAAIVAGRDTRWAAWDLVAPALHRLRHFPPGADRAYCNTGYLLLGLVVERVTGRGWAAEVTDRLLDPLGLRDTSTGTVRLPAPHARGYLTVDGRAVDVTSFDPSQAGAAGGLVSSLSDVNVFYRALLRGDLLPPDALAAMRAEGLGLGRHETPRGPVFGHDGGFFGFQTRSWHSVDGRRQLTLSATIFGNGALPPTEELVAAVAG
ncbi:D-alanyl-D-alanine carboxypeptidase [Asanoa ferruginea]|uniref:D-alanyl-D-alanine carboxypeptidase n=1 Tax=Asanoa ferruginea TaxID=53367 RepID=A0A3D9ZUT2_9ACTN|nr:serine hydrolase domain-containing protein [Asanoa ferruginea]REG00385.1 D-alanyl-D-alanine carboxypeptidase [Asanoa ferruginea]GIF52737.1 serine hydrolase [Asanoa ferruginea]